MSKGRSMRARKVGARLVWVAALVSLIGQVSSSPAEGVVPGQFSHVAILLLENHEYDKIIGQTRKAPYLNSLASQKVLFTNFFAVSHPSLPNYLALGGGSTFGVTTDSTPPIAGPSIVDQLEGAGISWKGYMETMPNPCFLGSSFGKGSKDYVLKHNPFLNFQNVINNSVWCNKVVPYTELANDLANNTLPQYVWITPNECDDMHSCTIAKSDAWLAANVPALLAGLGTNGILIITFDEGSTALACCGLASGGGHIVTIVAGPGAANATQIGTATDLYSILRLTEDAFGLSHLNNAATAPDMTGFECVSPPC